MGKNTIVKDTIILFIITLVAGLALAVVHEITLEPIAQANYNIQQNAYRTVYPEAAEFRDLPDFDSEAATALVASPAGDTIDGCVQAVGEDGSLLGYVITVTDPNGYGGDVTFSMGLTLEGEMKGYSFTVLNETPGLGSKARDDASFSAQYVGKTVESFELVKTTPAADNQIQAISGVTVTSSAVTNGVNAGLAYYQEVMTMTGGELK